MADRPRFYSPQFRSTYKVHTESIHEPNGAANLSLGFSGAIWHTLGSKYIAERNRLASLSGWASAGDASASRQRKWRP